MCLALCHNHLSAVRLLAPRFAGGTQVKGVSPVVTAHGRFRLDILAAQLYI